MEGESWHFGGKVGLARSPAALERGFKGKRHGQSEVFPFV